MTFEFLEKQGPFLARSCSTHDATSVKRRPLAGRSRCVGVGQEFAGPEGRGMADVGIQRQDERWTFQNDSHTGMAMAMDAPLVSFGLSKPALQIQIVEGKVRIISPDKQPRCETAHDLGHVPADRILLFGQGHLQCLERGLSLRAGASGGVKRGGYLLDHFDVPADLFLRRANLRYTPVDASGQTPYTLLDAPPFWASRFRCSDWRTSPNASVIRKPGGSSGPP